jgi:hypothetical protein
MDVKFKTRGLERCLAGSHHSSSAQPVVQEVILAESKTILSESDLSLFTEYSVEGVLSLSPELEADGGVDKSRMDGARPRSSSNPGAICVKR